MMPQTLSRTIELIGVPTVSEFLLFVSFFYSTCLTELNVPPLLLSIPMFIVVVYSASKFHVVLAASVPHDRLESSYEKILRV
jgi:hypothetical protein